MAGGSGLRLMRALRRAYRLRCHQNPGRCHVSTPRSHEHADRSRRHGRRRRRAFQHRAAARLPRSAPMARRGAPARRGQGGQGPVLAGGHRSRLVDALHDDNAPCFLFTEVPGTIKGSRVLVNFFGGKRKHMTLGFPSDLTKMELSECFRVHYAADMKRIPPKYVEDGPVMQNVLTGDAIDVTRFPAPQWHKPDGGRYIGTGSYNITRDPDDGWINCGTYRVMIHDEKSVGFYISPGKHGRQMRDKYQARGEPMPVAIVCGGDPMSFLMGCNEIPFGVSELDVIGGIRGAPVEVIKGPVTGLPIPANAEIVIEGFVEA